MHPIELIMVILLLGLLALVAVPQFTDLGAQARLSSEQGVVGGVRSGIYTRYVTNLAAGTNPAYPATLGGAVGVCSEANPCFGNVLSQPVTQDWTVIEKSALLQFLEVLPMVIYRRT